MRIDRVETALYRDSGGSRACPTPARRLNPPAVLARVIADDGQEGIGWTYSHGDSGRGMKEAIDTPAGSPAGGRRPPATLSGCGDKLWHSIFPQHHHGRPHGGGVGPAGYCPLGFGRQAGRPAPVPAAGRLPGPGSRLRQRPGPGLLPPRNCWMRWRTLSARTIGASKSR